MELVPIIYNSLLVVSAFLFSVVFISLACSKLNMCGKSNERKNTRLKNEYQPVVLNNKAKFEESERELQRDARPIMHEYALENKARVISEDNIWENRTMRENNFQSVSRYSIVNARSRVLSSNNGIYEKFSKMSVEYSQSA